MHMSAESPAVIPATLLDSYLQGFTARAAQFTQAAERAGTSPLYVFDPTALTRAYNRFQAAFSALNPGFKTYYALKSNDHPLLISRLTTLGCGLDVSSGVELAKALEANCRDIIFSGPGKTEKELEAAVRNADRVTLLLDSPTELARLQSIAERLARPVRAGVRLTTETKGGWRKFGIALDSLADFLTAAASRPLVKLRGLQFHTSWNRDPERQVEFLALLGRTLRRLSHNYINCLEFLDIGGGFWPERGDWLQPEGLPGQLGPGDKSETGAIPPRFLLPSRPIEDFAVQITAAFKKHIRPYCNCRLQAEPGRWLSDGALHILTRVLDKKAEDLVIVDGGINLIGWERFEVDFSPVINLTRPSREEKACLICGPLCTPRDFWAHSYFGKAIRPGDLLLIPDQGAYTYSLRQEFIKPIAPTITLAG